MYLDGEFYVTDRIVDLITIYGRNHYPQEVKGSCCERIADGAVADM